MQLIRLLAGLAFLSLGASSFVEASVLGLEADEQEATYLFRFFTDADEVRVQSHYAFYDLALENDIDLAMHVNHERVTIPAVSAPAGSEEAVDAITTASRPISGDAFEDFVKVRNEIQANTSVKGLDLGYYVSDESDYFAQQASAEYTAKLFGENLYVNGGTSYGWDRIEPLSDDDTATPDDEKTNLHGHVVLTRILTSTTLFRVGAEVNRVRGLQHNPYRNVYAGGGAQPEVHPDERLRRDYFVRVNQYFHNRSSLKLSYRFYEDDWGVQSHALGAKIHQRVGSWVDVRYRYRYYEQTAADFYRDEYEFSEGIDGFRSGDYRLNAVSSHLFGTRLDADLGMLAPESRWMTQFRVSFGYERYFNDTNFSANVFESGLNFQF